MENQSLDLSKLFLIDSLLRPYETELRHRYEKFQKQLKIIEEVEEKGLQHFLTSFKTFGIHVRANGEVHWLEWCPAATGLYAWGEFNNWTREQCYFTQKEHGKWQLVLPPLPEGTCRIPSGSIIKLTVIDKDGNHLDRISPWTVYVSQQEDKLFVQRFWNPAQQYIFVHPKPTKPNRLRIYEAHVGISSHHPVVATYKHFTTEVLPRIEKLGYNAIQLMAIMEHAYYASFGYQVTSFFASSSRFGTPSDLQELIDTAHGKGILVFLDLVHSHASKNCTDGLNQFDGTNACYFHDNARGYHNLWDSRLFNYSQVETLRFLLSNLFWWLEEYQFDGFRFDGVTSMLYHHHGLGCTFTGHYEEYFGMSVDQESLVYLMLANYLLHKDQPSVITIAEEVSGMPALCRPVHEGGVGFDYRLAMAVPDNWIKASP